MNTRSGTHSHRVSNQTPFNIARRALAASRSHRLCAQTAPREMPTRSRSLTTGVQTNTPLYCTARYTLLHYASCETLHSQSDVSHVTYCETSTRSQLSASTARSNHAPREAHSRRSLNANAQTSTHTMHITLSCFMPFARCVTRNQPMATAAQPNSPHCEMGTRSQLSASTARPNHAPREAHSQPFAACERADKHPTLREMSHSRPADSPDCATKPTAFPYMMTGNAPEPQRARLTTCVPRTPLIHIRGQHS